MQHSPLAYPDSETLAAGLSQLLGCEAAAGQVAAAVTILDRTPNIFTSSFWSEIVDFQSADQAKRRVLCKYNLRTWAGGAPRSMAYEAAVYRDVLQPLRTSTPVFHGLYTGAPTGCEWLVLEYAADGVHLNKAPACERHLVAAARWIGEFHAAAEERRRSGAELFLENHDADYYRGWAHRAWLYAGEWWAGSPWLRALSAHYDELVATLVAPPLTIVHGEYYPENILVRAETICPVDWESAAVAAGEVDLASLVEGWDDAVMEECVLEYQRARWPTGAPADFADRLHAARLYWAFRDCCRANGRITSEQGWRHLERFRLLGERTGLIS